MIFDGFNEKALGFLDEINENNNKVWFENNRYRWKEYILDANVAYVEEMGEHLIALDPFIKAKPKVSGSLFKIYRDVRFSKDKTPIKTKIGIIFWRGNTHRMQSSSFYMHYTSSEVFVASGIRTFKTDLLKQYREYIKVEKNAQELDGILNDLKEDGIQVVEPYYKRYPQGFKKEDKYAHLSLFNCLYAYTTFKPNKTFFSKRIINKNFKFYDKTLRLYEFLYEVTISK
ncbi:MAG: DUF2461 domain-containing protein [Campylobacteraceae bacterium]|nr:DUF2461 domain-containing protein [Campylobacteraceae bacterium]